jgi:hypothetical protein
MSRGDTRTLRACDCRNERNSLRDRFGRDAYVCIFCDGNLAAFEALALDYSEQREFSG